MTLPAVIIAVAAAAASVHLPVTTNDTQAQTAFDRGLFLYYAYNGDDAARAFEESAARDSHLAMAYWGIALAAGPDLNTPASAASFDAAKHAIRQAEQLAPAASPLEQRLIEAMARRYAGSFADWNADNAAYANAMTSLAKTTNDPNAKLLAAEVLLERGGLTWSAGHLSDEGSRTALAFVEAVLRTDPGNLMANHLCIHLYDLAPDRRPALPCAQRLDAATFPPQAEHLAHMPAHYWIETGNYAAAEASSERAFALMTSLENLPHGDEHVRRYAKHDTIVGYSAAMMLGNYANAERWGRRAATEYETSFDALTALRFGHYSEAFASAASSYGNPAVRGIAALHENRNAEAETLAKKLTAEKEPPRGYLARLFLARAAEETGNYAAAQSWIAKAADAQRDDFSGELIPLIPSGEALGFLELRRGNAAAAADAFTQTLETYPNDPRALFGLAQALDATGAHAEAARARSHFATIWKGADTELIGADLP